MVYYIIIQVFKSFSVQLISKYRLDFNYWMVSKRDLNDKMFEHKHSRQIRRHKFSLIKHFRV